MEPKEDRAAKLAADRGRVPPAKLAHVVRRTSRFAEMVRWYETVFGAKVVHSDGMLAFLTYDDEHHRFAIAALPGLEDPQPMAAGTDHVAFTHADLGDLLHTYARLKREGIEPFWCINHGPTTSMYYRDPDGLPVELQIDNFATMDEAHAYFTGPDFAENPIGVIFDPEQLIRDYEAGLAFDDLVRRPPLPPGKTPMDMRAER
jgi:catechol 2,3-dioxygenase-like lactoylglutathione lyase family enzyme